MKRSHLKRTKYEPIHAEATVAGDNNELTSTDRNNYSLEVEQEQPPSGEEASPQSSSWWVVFWVLGLLNNASYVIMLACAKSISEGGTALVFLFNVLPSLCVKVSAPYWFHKVGYRKRLTIASISMALSFAVIAASHWIAAQDRLGFQLMGVAIASGQCGLGEASLLALAGKVDSISSPASFNSDGIMKSEKGYCLTSFSSGTGLAGVFGFFWVWLLHDWLEMKLSTTLWIALSLPLSYFGAFRKYFWNVDSWSEHDEKGTHLSRFNCGESQRIPIENDSLVGSSSSSPQTRTPRVAMEEPRDEGSTFQDEVEESSDRVKRIDDMTGSEKFRLVLSLWPYMIPLFLVYAAEYALQAGTWTAIGLPDLRSEYDRDRFYEFSNWLYQAGVFVSRSSGTLFTAPIWLLWLMPVLQSCNVVLFSMLALNPSSDWYSGAFLYPLCFYVGLLGGAVYISGYKRICQDIRLEHREFSLAATSVAEGLGIMVADILGLVIQSCIYMANELEGALITCPA